MKLNKYIMYRCVSLPDFKHLQSRGPFHSLSGLPLKGTNKLKPQQLIIVFSAFRANDAKQSGVAVCIKNDFKDKHKDKDLTGVQVE